MTTYSTHHIESIKTNIETKFLETRKQYSNCSFNVLLDYINDINNLFINFINMNDIRIITNKKPGNLDLRNKLLLLVNKQSQLITNLEESNLNLENKANNNIINYADTLLYNSIQLIRSTSP